MKTSGPFRRTESRSFAVSGSSCRLPPISLLLVVVLKSLLSRALPTSSALFSFQGPGWRPRMLSTRWLSKSHLKCQSRKKTMATRSPKLRCTSRKRRQISPLQDSGSQKTLMTPRQTPSSSRRRRTWRGRPLR
ncbi:hypothetical protein B0H17DRAFT_1181887 [Mycena rosella]|uniref:Uncharacterized protein n=1 Tax=Mycena rosella TaxID=1033263 RepID=A0AAD7D6Q3_MYCRO|nr:hypothetical protein B0H17DRAFT_1181887 [Mycena rosella]